VITRNRLGDQKTFLVSFSPMSIGFYRLGDQKNFLVSDIPAASSPIRKKTTATNSPHHTIYNIV